MNICKLDDCTREVKYRGICHAHYQKFYRTGELDTYADPLPKLHRLSNINSTNKTAECLQCGPIAIIGNSRSTYRCRTQSREAGRNAHQTNPRRSRYYFADGDFIDGNVAQAARERFYVEQEGRCAICNRTEEEAGSTFHLDHCHTTGKLRGLLCGKCNRGIGYLNDDVKLLSSAIDYLSE